MTIHSAIEGKPGDLANPPGGILIWLIIGLELFVFGIGFVMIALFRINTPLLFLDGQSHLNLQMGILYTVLLLSSGWLTAEACEHFFSQHIVQAKMYSGGAILLGFIFLLAKGFDFWGKYQSHLSFGTNDFWDLFWFFSVFHYLHVMVGVGFLTYALMNMKKGLRDADSIVRGSAAFWHMCDVAWIFLFPLFYIG